MTDTCSHVTSHLLTHLLKRTQLSFIVMSVFYYFFSMFFFYFKG